MNRSEKIAKAVVEKCRPGAEMHHVDSARAPGHDFDLLMPDGKRYPLEVTESNDEAYRATIAAINQVGEVAAEQAQRSWDVIPMSDPDLDRIQDQVDSYLARIEAEGREQFFTYIDAATSPGVKAIMRDLNIEAGYSWEGSPEAKIFISWPGEGGLVVPQLVNDAVAREAEKPDNRAKVNEADAEERHLFVLIPTVHYEPWVALRSCDPPPEAPPLPEEITHIWAVGYSGIPEEYVVWTASESGGWEDHGTVTVSL